MTAVIVDNPFTDDFGNGSIPYGTVYEKYPDPLVAGSGITESGGVLRVRVDDSVAGLTLSDDAPRLRLRLKDGLVDGDRRDFVLIFKVTGINMTAVGGQRGSAGVGLTRTADIDTAWTPVIEFGGDTSTPKGFYSEDNSNVIGGVTANADLPSLPFYVRVVRADDVVYGEVASAIDGPWMSLSGAAAEGSRVRWVNGRMNEIIIFARSASAGGTGVELVLDDLALTTWDRFSAAVQVGHLTAATDLLGGKINLSWTLPPAGADDVRFMRIYRSKYGHPALMPPVRTSVPATGLGKEPPGELIYEGEPITSYEDTTVQANSFYYYSIFCSRAPQAATFPDDDGDYLEFANYPGDTDWGPDAPVQNQVTGLCIEDYKTADGEWVYNLFPSTYRELDQQDREQLGASSGYLQRFAEFMQRGFDFYRGMIAGQLHHSDPEKAVLGLVGVPLDQTSIVDAVLMNLGVSPNTPGIDGMTKRRLWLNVVDFYKRKGSIAGCTAWARLITRWLSLTCNPTYTNQLFIRTWDGDYTKEEFAKDDLVVGAGFLQSATFGLTPNAYAGGWYLDMFGNSKKIVSNTATRINFDDGTFTPIVQKRFNARIPTTSQIIIYPGGDEEFLDGPNASAFEGMKVWASTSAAKKSILNTQYQPLAAGVRHFLTETALTTSPSVTIEVSLAYDFSGGSYGARVPTMLFWLWKEGESENPTWMWDAEQDLYGPLGTLDNELIPVLYNSLDFVPDRTPATRADFIVWAPAGVAKYPRLLVQGVGTNYVDVANGPVYPDVLPGDYINPNRNQGRWFRITQIETANAGATTRYTTAEADGGGARSDQVGGALNFAVIAERLVVERDRALRALMPPMLPYGSRLFVHYL